MEWLRLIKLSRDHRTALMESKLEAQERTFKTISSELHDNISNSLLISKAQLVTMNLDDKATVQERINNSTYLIEKTINDLRNITKTLDSETIKRQGLIYALKNEIERLSISGLFTIETHFSGEVRKLGNEKELAIFRMTQEAINNIIKHSKAKVVDLSVNYHSDHIELIIIDNGVGFNYVSGHDLYEGSGLNNIRIRTQILKGQVNITSAPDQGTSICISIPYNDKYPMS
jgi:two-component system, NarL family, sensor kinase